MGTKLKKTVRNGGAQDLVTQYVGNFIYDNQDLDYIITPEGRIAATEDETPTRARLQRVRKKTITKPQ